MSICSQDHRTIYIYICYINIYIFIQNYIYIYILCMYSHIHYIKHVRIVSVEKHCTSSMYLPWSIHATPIHVTGLPEVGWSHCTAPNLRVLMDSRTKYPRSNAKNTATIRNMSQFSQPISGWCFFALALWKNDFSWDDDIPNIWKVIKFHGSKPPTKYGIYIYNYYSYNLQCQPLINKLQYIVC